MTKQYRVRYGDDQYTKVNTVNIVLANSASLEVDPEDDDLNIGEIEEDTGLTQQLRILHPSLPLEEVQGTHMEHLGTPSSPWSDQKDENDPEYPEQSDNPREHSKCDSPTEGNNENTLALPHPHHTLRLAKTQGTLTCRTPMQVAQGPWRQMTPQIWKRKVS